MEEKKTSKNLYGIISLCLMVLTAILEFIGLMNANFIFVVLSIITGISCIVLAIIGIVKATKLKKQIGKLKGIVLSIISIVFSLGILVVSIMEFGFLIYEQESGDTKFSIFAKSANLTEDEQARIREQLDKHVLEGDLRREVSLNIKTKMEIGSYQGIRHKKGLPVRGQSTRSNARTRKGKGKTVANKKK